MAFFQVLGRTVLLAAGLFVLAVGLLAWSGLRDRPGQADVMLVLGSGGIYRDGTPSPRLRSRLDRAAELDRLQSFRWIVVSGTPEKEGGDEAALMADYLAAHGVARDRIVADHGGKTTYDSARFTAAFLRERSLRGVMVVTQYFHLPRARLALERFGVAPVYSMPARRVEWHDISSLTRELAAWPFYALRSYPRG